MNIPKLNAAISAADNTLRDLCHGIGTAIFLNDPHGRDPHMYHVDSPLRYLDEARMQFQVALMCLKRAIELAEGGPPEHTLTTAERVEAALRAAGVDNPSVRN